MVCISCVADICIKGECRIQWSMEWNTHCSGYLAEYDNVLSCHHPQYLFQRRYDILKHVIGHAQPCIIALVRIENQYKVAQPQTQRNSQRSTLSMAICSLNHAFWAWLRKIFVHYVCNYNSSPSTFKVHASATPEYYILLTSLLILFCINNAGECYVKCLSEATYS